MQKKFKILSLQFQSLSNNKDANLKKVAKILSDNADFKPDLVLLPEVWNTGSNPDNFQEQAEPIPSITTMLLSSLAEMYKTNIVAGSIIEKTFDNKFYNTCLILNRAGAVISQYRKMHLFAGMDINEKQYLNNGEDVCVVDIDGIKFGIAICYDIRFPEQFRKMLKLGAEVFLVPAAFPQERIEQWNILTQVRALENQAILISCNQFGSSNVISPYGKIVSSSDSSEQVIQTTIDISDVITARNNNPYFADIIE